MCAYVHVSAVSEETRRGHQSLWSWSFMQLGITYSIWELGTELRSHGRAVCALHLFKLVTTGKQVIYHFTLVKHQLALRKGSLAESHDAATIVTTQNMYMQNCKQVTAILETMAYLHKPQRFRYKILHGSSSQKIFFFLQHN